jgi:hypothetical protein
MAISRDVLVLVAIAAAIILLSIIGLAAAFVMGLIGSLDGLLMIMVCLMMAGIFGGMLLLTAKEQGWLPARRAKKEEKAAAKSAAAPAPAAPAVPDRPVQEPVERK